MTATPTGTVGTVGTVARLAGVDLARGLAVFGMFAAHVGPDPDDGGAGVLFVLAQGRSSALFATLAGLSLALMTGRQRPLTGRASTQAGLRIAIRAAILLALGAALTLMDTGVKVILAYYGVYFLLALPLLRLSARALAAVSVTIAAVGPGLSYLLEAYLGLTGLDEAWADSDPLARLTDEGLAQLLISGNYPALTWMAYVTAGMALGRMDLTGLATRLRLAALGAGAVVLGYGGSALAQHLAGADPLTTRAWIDSPADSGPFPPDSPARLLVAAPHSDTSFEVVGNLGFVLLVLVAAVTAARATPRLVSPVVAVGAMSLTAYVAHLLVIDLADISTGRGAAAALLAFVVAMSAAAMLWRLWFRRGPLEYLMHQATALVPLESDRDRTRPATKPPNP
ncbi:heparan-alpha-glucosaminide N-acetyltransferase domain-containing protein [Pseudonocardia acaciae]|uniref:heparan-alpha-glucosaminide N-acetyltransferase domain-containing protein n=1 Tax=Pseudonocardia acaciae TaxID=551276 RepID=UPI000686CD3E|nr:heparan-alpha-glucosaminide N-acetyltransferase domain-containing protein [Pseudonocardia acaciae]